MEKLTIKKWKVANFGYYTISHGQSQIVDPRAAPFAAKNLKKGWFWKQNKC